MDVLSMHINAVPTIQLQRNLLCAAVDDTRMHFTIMISSVHHALYLLEGSDDLDAAGILDDLAHQPLVVRLVAVLEAGFGVVVGHDEEGGPDWQAAVVWLLGYV